MTRFNTLFYAHYYFYVSQHEFLKLEKVILKVCIRYISLLIYLSAVISSIIAYNF
jgi:hypothetical protein